MKNLVISAHLLLLTNPLELAVRLMIPRRVDSLHAVAVGDGSRGASIVAGAVVVVVDLCGPFDSVGIVIGRQVFERRIDAAAELRRRLPRRHGRARHLQHLLQARHQRGSRRRKRFAIDVRLRHRPANGRRRRRIRSREAAASRPPRVACGRRLPVRRTGRRGPVAWRTSSRQCCSREPPSGAVLRRSARISSAEAYRGASVRRACAAARVPPVRSRDGSAADRRTESVSTAGPATFRRTADRQLRKH
jgi:hypothetical protein